MRALPKTLFGADNSNIQLDHQRLLVLVNSMTDAFLALDADEKVVLCNSAMLNLLDKNTLDHKSIDQIMNLVDNHNKPVHIKELVDKTKKTFTSRELRLRYSDGSFINLYLTISPVYMSFGKKARGGHVILMRDITQEKSLEEERNEFISVASHELRTPIAIAEGSVSNALFLAEKAKISDTIQQNLQTAHQQIIFLGNLINDLSMLSRAERGKLSHTVEAIDIPALINELSTAHHDQASKKGLKLEVKISNDAKKLFANRLYLREILQNFLTNALKYTENGKVSINVRKAGESTEFEVVDSGIGISQADQDKLFTKFFRSDDWRVKRIMGTGLGLYVSAKLAKIMGATITVATRIHHGSSFSLNVPNKPTATKE